MGVNLPFSFANAVSERSVSLYSSLSKFQFKDFAIMFFLLKSIMASVVSFDNVSL